MHIVRVGGTLLPSPRELAKASWLEKVTVRSWLKGFPARKAAGNKGKGLKAKHTLGSGVSGL